MATGAETKIQEALFKRLSELVLSPTLPIAWPGNDFTPPASGGYLAVYLLPSPPEPVTFKTNRHIGTLQVSVFWPEDQGLTAPMERGSAISAHFKRGTHIYHEGIIVKITGAPSVMKGPQEGSWLQVPVDVPYSSFIPSG